MSVSYQEGQYTLANATATTYSSGYNVAGFNKIYITLAVPTCTDGGGGNTASVVFQTSNNNVDWYTVHTLVADNQPTSWDAQNYSFNFPDAAADGNGGYFGKYIRFGMVVGSSDTVSVSFTLDWIARA